MKFRGLLLAVLVLSALSGALYWSNRHPAKEKSELSSEPSPKILAINESDIATIDIKKRSGDEIVLAKDSSGTWKMTAPKLLAVDSSPVSSLASTLSSLNAERVVEDKASDLKQYGLAEPSLDVKITQKDNKSERLLIGDETPTKSAAYASLAGDPRVFTINSYSKTSIDKGPNDLRDKRLVTLESDKISRVEFLTPKQDIEFGRDKDQWQIVKPKPLRADNFKVDELVRKVTDAKMDLSGSGADAGKVATAFAHATAVGTLRVTGQAGTQQLQLRKNKDDYYGKSSIVEGVYKVANDLGQELSKSLDDFRNKKLFDFGYTDPNKIEMHDGAKSYFLTRSGSDWWGGDGKKMDPGTVNSFLDKLRDLEASKFVDSGFSVPVIQITVISGDGKRTERLLLAQKGADYIGKREDDASFYELNSKAVEELQRSAGDMKPQPAK